VSVTAANEPSTITMREKLIARQAPPKKNKAVNVVLMCLIVGLLIAGVARSIFEAKPAATTVMVVAAAEDIPPGIKLGYRNLHYMNVPKAYATPEMVATYTQLVGRTTTTFMAMGEPILASSLLPKTASVADVISVKQRAITLKMPAENMVDNAVRPGDRVDILATSTAPNGKKYTKTIGQNILVVFAAPKAMTLSKKLTAGEADKLTLSVPPELAETLTEASEVSKLRVVLRSVANHAIAVLPGASEADLLPHEALRIDPPKGHVEDDAASVPSAPAFMPPQPVTVLPAPVQWVVDVFKGAVKESHAFEQK
jgi:Flp pilus assembly protein CpaB